MKLHKRGVTTVGAALLLLSALVSPASAAGGRSAGPAGVSPAAVTKPVVEKVAAAQTLTWTADNDITRYKTAPTAAVAGVTTIVFENSEATGNTILMSHTLTFDTSTPGYNHDVTLNILANPFDANNGRHEATVTLTPGKYRYFCTIPGHAQMAGEFTVTGEPVEDETPPTVSATVSGQRDTNGDYIGSATVTVQAADNTGGSGIATVEYQVDDFSWSPYTAPVGVTAVGDHSVQFRATDNAGNVSTTGSVQFSVVAPQEEDTTPPTVAAAVTGDRDTQGRYIGSATVTVTATDDRSGVAGIEVSVDGAPFTPYTAPVVIDTPGEHMVHYRAVDNAGNESPEGMAAFTVVEPEPQDTTPPETTATVTGNRDGNGNYIGTATVTVAATDTRSGVRTVEYALDTGAFTAYTGPVTVGTTGPHSVRYRATDNAGNVAAEKTVTFTVVGSGSDACPNSDTRPTVVIRGDDTGVANRDTGNGCTINDLIAENGAYPDHATFVRHVQSVTAPLVTAGIITRRDQGAIVRAAAASDTGSRSFRAFF